MLYFCVIRVELLTSTTHYKELQMTYTLNPTSDKFAWLSKSGNWVTIKIHHKDKQSNGLSVSSLSAESNVRDALKAVLSYGVNAVYSDSKCDWYTQEQINKLLNK